MKLKQLLLIPFMLLVSISASATIIDFDSQVAPGTFGPSSGAGFVDSGFVFSTNMDVIDVSETGGWWGTGTGGGHSGKFAALNNYGDDMFMTQQGGGSFSVQDLWLHSWQAEWQTGAVIGWFNGSLVDMVEVSFSSPWQNVALNFANIDTLQITSSYYFLVDDIQINSTSVPESSSLVLMAIALAGLVCLRRRKQNV